MCIINTKHEIRYYTLEGYVGGHNDIDMDICNMYRYRYEYMHHKIQNMNIDTYTYIIHSKDMQEVLQRTAGGRGCNDIDVNICNM